MFFAGIDGGGTHTRLELRNENNQVLERRVFGPFNINSIGPDAFRTLLERVFAYCGDMARCSGVCVGGAGISNPLTGKILEECLKKAGFTGKWKLCGDQEIALRGALDVPGMILIAGTGSICFGKNAEGKTARTGGYGHILDDGGSGYALGREALAAAVRYLDGRGPGKALCEAVFSVLGVDTLEELISLVYGSLTDKARIARCAGAVLELAQAGDEPAREILNTGAAELAELVRATQKKLNLEGGPIALLGGLLETDNVYRELVSATLAPLGQVCRPNHDALWGAAQMAWELGQGE